MNDDFLNPPTGARAGLWRGIRALLAVAGLVVMTGCTTGAMYYESAETAVRVVDAKTGRPIPNTIVVFSWAAEDERGQHNGYVHLKEAYTDKYGWAVAEKWGPQINIHPGQIQASEPTIFLLRPQYGFHSVNNLDLAGHRNVEDKRRLVLSLWNGREIELHRARGNVPEYLRRVAPVRNNLLLLLDDGEKKEVPCTIVAANELGEYFESRGRKNRLRWDGSRRDYVDLQDLCPITEFLEKNSIRR